MKEKHAIFVFLYAQKIIGNKRWISLNVPLEDHAAFSKVYSGSFTVNEHDFLGPPTVYIISALTSCWITLGTYLSGFCVCCMFYGITAFK